MDLEIVYDLNLAVLLVLCPEQTHVGAVGKHRYANAAIFSEVLFEDWKVKIIVGKMEIGTYLPHTKINILKAWQFISTYALGTKNIVGV